MKNTKTKKNEVMQVQSQVVAIPLESIIVNPLNSRNYFDEDELLSLAENIDKIGLICPITVRNTTDEGKYEIICGERRFRAHKLLNKEFIDCIIRDMNNDIAYDSMLSENLQRKSMLPMEECIAFNWLMDVKNYTEKDIAIKFGVSISYVHGRRMLKNLNSDFQVLLNKDEITIGVAQEIATYSESVQEELYQVHFSESAYSYNSWRRLSTKGVCEKLKSKYNHRINSYNFDRTDCLSCNFNSALISLFPEQEEGICKNPSCLIKKLTDIAYDKCLELNQKYPDYKFCYVSYYGKKLPDLIGRLELGGITTYAIDYSRDLITLPKEMEEPNIDTYLETCDSEEDAESSYDEAMGEFFKNKTLIENMEERVSKGELLPVINIEGYLPEISLCFAESINKAIQEEEERIQEELNDDVELSNENTAEINKRLINLEIEKLKSTDKRNEAIKGENIVKDVRYLLRDCKTPLSEVEDWEEELFYFCLLHFVPDKNLQVFKKNDKDDDWKHKVYKKLKPEQKSMLLRDVIIQVLYKNSYGVSKTSNLLVRFAEKHFSKETKEIKDKYKEIYKKRKSRMEEKVQDLEQQLMDDQETTFEDDCNYQEVTDAEISQLENNNLPYDIVEMDAELSRDNGSFDDFSNEEEFIRGMN